MMLLGGLIVAHGIGILLATIAGAIGYCSRKLWKDAVGVMATIGVSTVAEITLGLMLVF